MFFVSRAEINRVNQLTPSLGYPANIEQPSSLLRLVQLTLIALSFEIENSHMNINPAEKQLLASERISKVTREITEAIKPKVASFLLYGKQFTLAKYYAISCGAAETEVLLANLYQSFGYVRRFL